MPDLLIDVIGHEDRLKSSPVNFAAGLSILALSASKTGELEQVGRLITELRALRVRYPEQEEVALRLAQAPYNAALAHQIAGELEQVDALVAELRSVGIQYPGQAEIVLELAKALYNAAVHYGDSGELHRVDELLAELGTLRNRYPETDENEVAMT